jgi:hypothetical protein
LIAVTTALLTNAMADTEAFLANATPFLHLVGHTIVASCWLEQALVAERGGDGFCKAKLAAAKYFFRWELPRTEAWAKVLTPIERTPLDLDPDWL